MAALSAALRRPLTLIAGRTSTTPGSSGPRRPAATASTPQWSDDFHHAVHVALTGETSGYYADFAPLSALAKVCERGFFHDGTWSSFRGPQPRPPDRPRHHPPGGSSCGTTTRSATGARRPAHRGARRAPARVCRDADALQAVHADALHGRGGRRPRRSSSSLHPGPRLGPGRRRRRIAGFSRWAGTPRSCRSAGPDDLPAVDLDWSGRRPTGARVLDVTAGSGGCGRRRPGATDPSFGGFPAGGRGASSSRAAWRPAGRRQLRRRDRAAADPRGRPAVRDGRRGRPRAGASRCPPTPARSSAREVVEVDLVALRRGLDVEVGVELENVTRCPCPHRRSSRS